ncbi:MAG: hypothetical protein KAT32_02435 [Candidatus Moranbacteria bacterium]|nr:hypothetical protein [Candidatus Moranbacteria bacterium]
MEKPKIEKHHPNDKGDKMDRRSFLRELRKFGAMAVGARIGLKPEKAEASRSWTDPEFEGTKSSGGSREWTDPEFRGENEESEVKGGEDQDELEKVRAQIGSLSEKISALIDSFFDKDFSISLPEIKGLIPSKRLRMQPKIKQQLFKNLSSFLVENGYRISNSKIGSMPVYADRVGNNDVFYFKKNNLFKQWFLDNLSK